MNGPSRPEEPRGAEPGGVYEDIGRRAEASPGTSTERGPTESETGPRTEEGEVAGEHRESEPGQLAEQARERTERLIRENRRFAGEFVGSYSCALEAMARTLDDEGRVAASAQVDRAAQELGRVSSRLRRESLTDLAHEVEGQARRRPAIAFGGAALAGFALSRFLKSSRSK